MNRKISISTVMVIIAAIILLPVMNVTDMFAHPNRTENNDTTNKQDNKKPPDIHTTRIVKLEAKAKENDSAIKQLKKDLGNVARSSSPVVNETSWFEWKFNIVPVLITLIAALMICVLFYKRQNDELKKLIDEKTRAIKRNVSDDLEQRLNVVKEGQTENRRLVNALESEVVSTKQAMKVLETKQAEAIVIRSSKADDIPVQINEVFFMAIPNSDGSFNADSAKRDYKAMSSIYQFTKTSNSRARFQIDSREQSMNLALGFADKSIEPVCEAINAYSPRAKSVITIEPGECELRNEKWYVLTKARVKYVD